MDRKIYFKFGEENNLRKRCILLPHESTTPDLFLLKMAVLRILKSDGSIRAIGGCETTTEENLIVLRFDNFVEEYDDMTVDDKLPNMEKDITISIEKAAAGKGDSQAQVDHRNSVTEIASDSNSSEVEGKILAS